MLRETEHANVLHALPLPARAIFNKNSIRVDRGKFAYLFYGWRFYAFNRKGFLVSKSQFQNAWDDRHLTPHQKRWMVAEARIISRLIAAQYPRGATVSIADVGCGDARIAKRLAEQLKRWSIRIRYVGFDRDAAVIRKASRKQPAWIQFAKPGPYQKALPFWVRTKRNGTPFDVVICTGNTLGTLRGNRAQHVRRIARYGLLNVVSVLGRGKRIVFRRLEYYLRNGYSCSVDWVTNTIRSQMWGQSRAWDRKGLLSIALQARDRLQGSRSRQRATVHRVAPLGLVLSFSA